MEVSEKSLELNIGAEVLDLLRNHCGMQKAYLRGLTQAEERREGADFFAQLSPDARIFAFQFKAPQGHDERPPYRYTLVRDQHKALFDLTQGVPGGVYYVFPFYVTVGKLQLDVPVLARDTWLLDVSRMPTDEVFGNFRTRTIHCGGGVAWVNPKYQLELLHDKTKSSLEGIPASRFASWYKEYRNLGRTPDKARNPWFVRTMRLAIFEPA